MAIAAKLIDPDQPSISEAPGVPERFCEVAVVRDYGETIRIILGRENIPGSDEIEATCIIIMPRSGFMRSLGWAATQFLWTRH